MKTKKTKNPVTMMAFVIPDGLLAKLRVRAKAKDRNVSEMVRHIIKAALERK